MEEKANEVLSSTRKRGRPPKSEVKVVKRAKYNSPLTDIESTSIIHAHGRGMSSNAIASLHGVGRSQVRTVIKKFLQGQKVTRKGGPGRPRKTTPNQDRKIVSDVKRNPRLSCRDIQSINSDLNVSTATVRRRIVETGEFGSYFTTRKPFISKINRQKRLAWAKAHKNWTVDEWKRVLWSDESPFVLRFKRKQRIWRRHSDRFNIANCDATVKHDKKVNVWGCFAAHGVGRLYRVEGILEKHQYQRILQDEMLTSKLALFGESAWFFQQDNDPKHTANINKDWLLQNDVPTMEWPSQSPDLNPIENLWSILDYQCRGRTPNNENELFQCLLEAWNCLSLETLHNLIESMPRRCAAVIKSRGYATKY